MCADTPAQLQNRTENAALLRWVDSMRTHGHRAARIDPLDILQRVEVPAVDPTRYGLVDVDKVYNIDGIVWNEPLGPGADFGLNDEPKNNWWTLGDVTRHLRSIYMGRIAYEYMHSPSKSERLWFSHFLESQTANGIGKIPEVMKKNKKRIHSLLARSETLDNFLQAKFPNLKRYGLEGGESMLPALDSLFKIASEGTGFRSVVQLYILIVQKRWYSTYYLSNATSRSPQSPYGAPRILTNRVIS